MEVTVNAKGRMQNAKLPEETSVTAFHFAF